MGILKNTLINDTGYLQLPSGTTEQRPSNPSAGMIRWNTSFSAMEVYTGTEWKELDLSGGIQGTYNNPGTSAQSIYDSGQTTSGLYYVTNPNINSGNPFQVYCDMDKDGGGWMLVLTVDGTSVGNMGWNNTTVQSRNTSFPSLSTAYSILSWADYFTASSGWQWMVEATDTATTRYTFGGIFTANGNYSINSTSNAQTNISVNEWFTGVSSFVENSGIGPRVPYRDVSGTQAGTALYTTYPGSSSWWGTIVQADTYYSNYKSGPWLSSAFPAPNYKRVWVR